MEQTFASMERTFVFQNSEGKEEVVKAMTLTLAFLELVKRVKDPEDYKPIGGQG